jgi:hypothetical protein
MELGLNLFWLLTCAIAGARWGLRAPRRSKSPRRFQQLRLILPLACVLSLLFPIISISDDLQDIPLPTAEPDSRKVVKYTTSWLSPISSQIRHVPIAFGAVGLMIFCPRCFGYVLPASHRSAASRALSSREIRGPPSR